MTNLPPSTVSVHSRKYSRRGFKSTKIRVAGRFFFRFGPGGRCKANFSTGLKLHHTWDCFGLFNIFMFAQRVTIACQWILYCFLFSPQCSFKLCFCILRSVKSISQFTQFPSCSLIIVGCFFCWSKSNGAHRKLQRRRQEKGKATVTTIVVDNSLRNGQDAASQALKKHQPVT